MDSEIRRTALMAVANACAMVACLFVAATYRSESPTDPLFWVFIVFGTFLGIAAVILGVHVFRHRSRVGKVEVTFVSLRKGEYRGEPPVVGKRPPS